MEELPFFELPDLELFFKKIGADISRTTITRYGQNGLMFNPRRKDSLDGLKDSRIYYNPVVAIEILVAYMMLNGEFGQLGGKTKMAQFTVEDVFFARLRHHIDFQSLKPFYSSDFFTTVRIPKGKKLVNHKLYLSNWIYEGIFYRNSYLLMKQHYDYYEETEDEKLLKVLQNRYDEYISLFSPVGLSGEEVEHIQKDYLSLLDHLYGVLFYNLLNKYKDRLKGFKFKKQD